MPDTTPPSTDGPWPTEPRLLGPDVEALYARLARARSKQAEANRRWPGRFLPTLDPDDDGLTPAGRQQLAWESVVPLLHSTWRLDNLTDGPAEQAARCDRWLVNGTGVLLLAGNIGSGKTALACAVARAWWEGGRRQVLYARVDDLVRSWVDRDDQELLALRRKVERARAGWLVVLDDLGTSAVHSPTVAANLNNLVAGLVDAGCRVVVTTNLDKAERVSHLDKRLRSRVEAGTALAVTGPDLRGRPLPPRPATDPCSWGCQQPQGLLMVETFGADAIEIECNARGLTAWPSGRPPTPRQPAPLGKGTGMAAGHWHGGPYPCPVCGGMAPGAGVPELSEADRLFKECCEAMVPCPHCRPEMLNTRRPLHRLVLRRAGLLPDDGDPGPEPDPDQGALL